MLGLNFAAVLMAIFVAGSNYLVKVPINDWITWGAFLYPFTYFITELTNYFYGKKAARQVVYLGFIVAALFSITIADHRIAFASVLAFLVSQLLDISIFSKLRQGSWWIAPIVASIAATFLDSLLFFSVAFVGTPVPWFTFAVGTFCTKGLIDIALLLPFRMFMAATRSGTLTVLNNQKLTAKA